MKNKTKILTVALADIDVKAGYLPDFVAVANESQDHYRFQVEYLVPPAGCVKRNLGFGPLPPQMYVPILEAAFVDETKRLGVDFVCCLTRHPLASHERGKIIYNYFSMPFNNNSRVAIISTDGLREYAKEANVSYSGAVLHLCLSQILIFQYKRQLTFHHNTVGCLFDFCENRADIVKGLRRLTFDHSVCRAHIKDTAQLRSINALLALKSLPEI